MYSDAYIDVTCDGCHHVEQVQLTSIARNGWDERNVPAYLKNIGWSVLDDKHYCEECVHVMSEAEAAALGKSARRNRPTVRPKSLPTRERR